SDMRVRCAAGVPRSFGVNCPGRSAAVALWTIGRAAVARARRWHRARAVTKLGRLMYVTIGKKNPKTDLIDALLECHERIRTFIDVAQRIATSPNAPPEEIREAATRVRRYFDEALPRHVADEEQSILPRLAGK